MNANGQGRDQAREESELFHELRLTPPIEHRKHLFVARFCAPGIRSTLSSQLRTLSGRRKAVAWRFWSLRDYAPASASDNESLSVRYRLHAEALEPTGFEPVTSSMPLRRSTN